MWSLKRLSILRKKGFEVKAVYQSDEVRKVYKELDETKKEKTNLEVKDITKREFEENKYQLINSQYTLHFLSEDELDSLLDKLKESLKTRGILSINLLGYQDEWNKPENNMNFHSTEEIKKIFSEMEIIKYKEELKDGEKADGSSKYWHIHKIIAKKKAK
jgi:cyclopropane fatty-acyl-phospholipid synthase-like methyltransferase